MALASSGTTASAVFQFERCAVRLRRRTDHHCRATPSQQKTRFAQVGVLLQSILQLNDGRLAVVLARYSLLEAISLSGDFAAAGSDHQGDQQGGYGLVHLQVLHDLSLSGVLRFQTESMHQVVQGRTTDAEHLGCFDKIVVGAPSAVTMAWRSASSRTLRKSMNPESARSRVRYPRVQYANHRP